MTARDTVAPGMLGPGMPTAPRASGGRPQMPMALQRPLNQVSPRPGSNGLGQRRKGDDWIEECGVKPAMAARLHLFAEAWGREVETRFRSLASQRRGGMQSGRGGQQAPTILVRDLRPIIDAFYPFFDALVKLLLRDAGWEMTTRLHIGHVRCLTEAERGEDILLALK